jgi:hypothetical protein
MSLVGIWIEMLKNLEDAIHDMRNKEPYIPA